MTRLVFAVLAAFFLGLGSAGAQSANDVVWIQIEARPNLAQATERARDYGAALQDVNGFALGGGWYGIVVGPYTRGDAELLLRAYRREGVVPRDSFIQVSERFQQQFWPVGANVLNIPLISPRPADDAAATAGITESVLPPADAEPAAETPLGQTTQLPTPPAPDETVAQARRSERLLTRPERETLQIALQWAGFYNASIDGAFGRGTRGSMAAWQSANGYPETGILTTAQRADLLRQYNAVLDGLGLERVRDARAGIEMVLPKNVVSFARYEPPFAHYDATGDIGARVLLISQAGDRDTLYGLYDIMQTLEIVPTNGPRERRQNGFELIGENGRIVSQTQVSLENGQIKGFSLIWPAGDEERRRRVVAEMTKSFTRLPGVLDDAAGSGGENQAINLVAGLEVRMPLRSRSGFFIDASGTVATTTQAVEGCGRLTLDDTHDLDLLTRDAASGIALLTPRVALAPMEVARFAQTPPRLQSEIAVAGYPYEGVLGAPTVTFGTLADVRGLHGDQTVDRLTLKSQPGDAGGPVFDGNGLVFAMLLPRADGSQQLPEETNFAVNARSIGQIAQAAGVAVQTAQSQAAVSRLDLREKAKRMTVLVSCWE